MNSQDFQNICETLHVKYDEHRLTDADVDAFADVVTNVLGRDDLRADGTSYERLAGRINHDYENDIAMNPLLARMYELCRMYAMYRPRPLTEMERKEEQMEVGKVIAKKYPACISLTDGRKVLASCWWENVDGMDEIAAKVEKIAEILLSAGDIAGRLDANEVEAAACFLDAFAKVDAGLDPLDTAMIDRMESVVSRDDIAVSENPSCGIVALDRAGIERNRERGGANVKMDVIAETVYMDAYTVYGSAFYKTLVGMAEDEQFPALEELRDENVSFSFVDAEKTCTDWQKRLGEVFALPGSKNLVGTKKPVAVK